MTETTTAAGLGLRYHVATFGGDLQWRSNGPDLDGVFAGYGSVFDVTDSYGTRMRPGCWRAGGLDDRPYALLWMHNPEVVLGTFRAKEDERGLWIEGQYDATDVGQRARSQAQSGSAPELSVGFVQLATQDDDTMAITQARLVEVSQITARMAATPGAALAAVRSGAHDLLTRALPADVQRDVARARARLNLT